MHRQHHGCSELRINCHGFCCSPGQARGGWRHHHEHGTNIPPLLKNKAARSQPSKKAATELKADSGKLYLEPRLERGEAILHLHIETEVFTNRLHRQVVRHHIGRYSAHAFFLRDLDHAAKELRT
jgi:hypothetical protein